MKFAHITNGFFVSQKTEEIRDILVRAFARRGVEAAELRNDELLVGDVARIKSLGVSVVLFWDKDHMLARQLEDLGLCVVNGSEAIRTCDDKGLTALVAARNGIPTPRTVVAPFTYENIGYDNYRFLSRVKKLIDFPIVVKESHGSFGQQVYLARDERELEEIVIRIGAKPMIFQQYIECGNSDLRLQVVGDKVVAAVRRTSAGDFRANATLGGKMTAYEPTSDEVELAIAAARAVGAEIAGVDILPGEKPLLCEVNGNAHFKRLMDATGVDVADKIVDYILSKA